MDMPKINEPYGLPQLTIIDQKITEVSPGTYEIEVTYRHDSKDAT